MKQTENIIEVRNLEFRWRDGMPAILDVAALSLGRGERLFIKGASGSGKSTLLSLLGGVITPQRGEITVLGRELNTLSGAQRDHFRADHIGFIFQMFNLLPYLPVLENVVLPCRFSRLRRDRAAKRGGSLEAEARRLLTDLDLGSEQVLSAPVTVLSVGQQQRVAAARALIGGPEILIADEPTSSLDADRREAFLNLLLRECEAQRISLVFVSHDASLERLFDRAVSLADINRAGTARAAA
jgi:putative ABC transport system ATP-binding protein